MHEIVGNSFMRYEPLIDELILQSALLDLNFDLFFNVRFIERAETEQRDIWMTVSELRHDFDITARASA
jgi:hypothetical protein